MSLVKEKPSGTVPMATTQQKEAGRKIGLGDSPGTGVIQARLEETSGDSLNGGGYEDRPGSDGRDAHAGRPRNARSHDRAYADSIFGGHELSYEITAESRFDRVFDMCVFPLALLSIMMFGVIIGVLLMWGIGR